MGILNRNEATVEKLGLMMAGISADGAGDDRGRE
jgi:hypothetical protein